MDRSEEEPGSPGLYCSLPLFCWLLALSRICCAHVGPLPRVGGGFLTLSRKPVASGLSRNRHERMSDEREFFRFIGVCPENFASSPIPGPSSPSPAAPSRDASCSGLAHGSTTSSSESSEEPRGATKPP